MVGCVTKQPLLVLLFVSKHQFPYHYSGLLVQFEPVKYSHKGKKTWWLIRRSSEHFQDLLGAWWVDGNVRSSWSEFSRPGEVMDLRKMAWVMEKSWNFIFWYKYSVLFENWKYSPCRRAKICPKMAWFLAFLCRGKFKLVMENSLNFIAQFLCEPCYRKLLKGLWVPADRS